MVGVGSGMEVLIISAQENRPEQHRKVKDINEDEDERRKKKNIAW